MVTPGSIRPVQPLAYGVALAVWPASWVSGSRAGIGRSHEPAHLLSRLKNLRPGCLGCRTVGRGRAWSNVDLHDFNLADKLACLLSSSGESRRHGSHQSA